MTLSKLKLIPVILVLLSFSNTYALDQKNYALVKNVLDTFKGNNINAIAKLISYPLEREAPLPDINNEREFIQRFNDVFDQNLLQSIARSDIQKDWDEVGWRGIMLGSGDVWLNHDGKISAINYQSNREQMVSNQLRAKGRRALHRSVSQYAKSILEWKTERFHIRVDEVGNGQLRYVAWPNGKRTSEAPDIVLLNGKSVIDGSGRNHRYEFSNGNFSYHLNMNVVSTGSEPARKLEVFNGNKEILSEIAKEIRK